ncbi:pentatricopeptide repeat-containing protein At1g76280 isoform X2 [Benincasa hispida]|nr:pentatricopeptide repeat-containing protein At1g76280 isoform X2 [Benincasa hispida]XP_038897389.1 pentatricopeptide repeat-containing protein At1g76280 isoform X2 [Benincasa hispida]XP_038897390.1 pentatricopeptide repeat-containing protein At1g76280 isoform X2 [Benincasa hispida]
MQMQIVDALRLGDINSASNLLMDLGQEKHSLTADSFVPILSYCARSPDPLFVMETWKIMEERGIFLNNTCSLLIIEALCKGGYLDEAFGLINFLAESHVMFPVLPVYNCFLRACVKRQSMVHVSQCLDLMDHRMVGKNEATYSKLLELAVCQKNLSSVHEIWTELVKNYSPSVLSLRKFIWSCTRLGDLKSAYTALQKMVALATGATGGKSPSLKLDIPIPSRTELYCNNFTFEENGPSTDELFCKKLVPCSGVVGKISVNGMKCGEVESGPLALPNNHRSSFVMKVLRWSFNDVIHACARTRNCGLAEQLMQQMHELGVQPSRHTFDGFVRSVVSERGFSDGMKILKIMQQRELEPYDSTLAAVSISCSKALELDLAEALLERISTCLYPHPFNAFLSACDTMDQPERAMRMFAKMRQMEVLPDIKTYGLLYSLFGNVNAPYEEASRLSQVDAAKRIRMIEIDMEKHGIQHSLVSMMNLLKALGAEGMTKELLQYLNVAENLFYYNHTCLGTPVYNTVLHFLVESKEIHMAIEVFNNMKHSGFFPDAVTFEIMIDCCSVMGCLKSAFVLLSMMIRSGFCPQILTYTSLIKIVLEFERFDDALNLLDQASSEGIELDVLIMNKILQKAREKVRVDVIEFVVEKMNRKRIQPNPSTCHDVFSTYVNLGYHSTAMEALQVLSMRMLCKEDDTSVTEYIENFVLAEDAGADSRILEFFKCSEESLSFALFNLRWSAMLGYSLCSSPSQSPWAMRLASSYDGYRIS